MPDQDPLFVALRRFAHMMSRPCDLTDALYEICDQITDIVGAAGAGVGLLDENGDLRFVTATNEATVAAEQAQERTQSVRAELQLNETSRSRFAMFACTPTSGPASVRPSPNTDSSEYSAYR